MCGIAGIFRVDGRITADDVVVVLRMMNAQVHRGPDDWGILLPEEAQQDSRIRGLLWEFDQAHVRTYRGSSSAPACILGSRRLSIIDLSPRGRMPMATHDGRVWLTYNGEIYNYRELRNELKHRGYVFRSNTDTETILLGYEEWGEAVLQHLRGMFAFAILDARSSDDPKLFLAKDRFGMKPLYWARHNRVFQFASEVRALTAGGLIPEEPEPRGLHGFLIYGSVPTPFTTVRDVFSLSAAHVLSIDQLSYSYPKPRRYWRLPRAGSVTISQEEAVTETRRLLDESIRMHLVSDVTCGLFLSGGMDSSAIAALAARHVDEPLLSLCVTFDDIALSEGNYAETVANQFGCKYIEARVNAHEFVEEIPRILSAMDQPSIDGVNVYFVAKAAKAAGLKSVLSGLGGDELFWGYPGFHRASQWYQWTRLPGIRTCARLIGALGKRMGFDRLEKLEFLKDSSALGVYLLVRGLFPPGETARLLQSGTLPLFHPESTPVSLGPSDYAQLEASCYLQNQLLRDSDVFGMAHGLEIRLPFLDHRLAELVFALPKALKNTGARNKPLLRAALRQDLGESILNRPKSGFTFPFERWMRENSDRIQRQTGSASIIASNALDAAWNAFGKGRLHWSRPWAISVLNGMGNRGSVRPLPLHTHPKRILFLLPEVYASKGGIPVYIQHFLRAVGESFPAAELRAISLNDVTMPSDAQANGRIHFIGCGPRGSSFFKARVIRTVLGEVVRHRPDLIVCGHIHLAPLVLLQSVVLATRRILLAYGIEIWQPSMVRRWAARRMGQIVSISNFTESRMAKWGVESALIRVIPPDVDGEALRPLRKRKRKDNVTLLTVARLNASERYKGVDLVLMALGKIVALHPNIRYVVAGEGDDRPHLEALTKSAGLSDKVLFRSSVSDQELCSLFNEADLFVMPSRHEGFGIVFLEALACGLPIIAGNQDGSVEALLKGRIGLLVDPNHPQQLEQTLLNFLDGKISQDLLDGERLRAEVLTNYGFDVFRDRVREVLSAQW